MGKGGGRAERREGRAVGEGGEEYGGGARGGILMSKWHRWKALDILEMNNSKWAAAEVTVATYLDSALEMAPLENSRHFRNE